MEKKRGAHRILVGRHEGKDHLDDLGVDRKIILNFIFNKYIWETEIGFIWLRFGTSGELLLIL